MDLFTHVLFGNLVRKSLRISDKKTSAIIISATIIPDIGEIIIQNALSKKFNTKFAVYDVRTSDLVIASDISVTWFYDLFHSFFFAMALFLIAKYWVKSNGLFAFSMGLFSHILLDCATHGKVWALKLFFPVSNQRFEILADSLGNWWDWKPVIELPFLGFPFPTICFVIWILLVGLTVLIQNKKHAINAKN